MLKMSVAGKVIVVTGASSGIGAAGSEVLAKAGGLVGLVGCDRARLDQVVSLWDPLDFNFKNNLYQKIQKLFIESGSEGTTEKVTLGDTARLFSDVLLFSSKM